MIVIIDYHVGNLMSVQNAFLKLGMDVVVSRDHDVIPQAKGIVLPGVGTFPVAMEHLKKYDLIDILKERKEAGIPILGICLGMQILFEKGYEVTPTEGLGFLKGEVKLMDVQAKIPHMGWNELVIHRPHEVLEGLPLHSYVYFVHSYYKTPGDTEDVIASADYGVTVPAVVGKDNVLGFQFHPEKSGSVGMAIWDRLAKWLMK